MSRLHTACAVVAALFLAASMFGHTVALRLLLLFTGIVLAAVIVAREKEVRGLPAIWIPFFLWGAWALLSLAWSLEPERTLKEWRNEVVYTGAALWLCFVGAQARNAVPIFLTTVTASLGLAGAVAIYESSRGWESYLSGWHGGPGDHSSALVTLIACIAMAGWYARRAGGRRWVSVGLWLLMGMMLASGYATLNRTLWIAFAVQFALLGGLLLARDPGVWRSPRTRLTLAAGGAIALLACGAIVMSIQGEREAFGAKTFEGDNRLALWPEVARHVRERPLLGYGFGRGVLRHDLQEKFAPVDQNLWHAHNLFLEALVQLGVPGLLLLALLLGALLREGWRTARSADEALAACGMALLGALAGMLVRNMTDSLLVRQNALLFWGVSGVLLAWGSRRWRA